MALAKNKLINSGRKTVSFCRKKFCLNTRNSRMLQQNSTKSEKNLQKQNVYFISGLGADWRLFQRLKLPDHFNLIHLDWIKPLGNETIAEYGARLAQQIDTSQTFQLVGLSFGGMIASEIAKQLTPLQTIIISSASSAKEIPWYFKTAGSLHLPEVVPVRLLRLGIPVAFWFFGAKGRIERRLLREIIRDIDDDFLHWALKAITSWKSTERPPNLFQIHGDADKILPVQFTRPDLIVENAEHLMVLTKADYFSDFLSQKMNHAYEMHL
jgi:pimeloyl-ACP methyl ester carboxylesterase